MARMVVVFMGCFPCCHVLRPRGRGTETQYARAAVSVPPRTTNRAIALDAPAASPLERAGRTAGSSNVGNVTVIGAQWGDEGKGKIVDWLASRADMVVRFQGGHNAGHTLVVGEPDLQAFAAP